MLSPSLCTPFFRGPSFVSSSTWSGMTPAIFISAPFQASDSQLDYVLKSPGELLKKILFGPNEIRVSGNETKAQEHLKAPSVSLMCSEG